MTAYLSFINFKKVMMTFDILPSHLDLIHAILKKNLPHNTTVWIFGSRVQCAQKKYSDLDLLIDCQKTKLPDMILIALKDDFDESDLPYKVDLLDWHVISDAFKKQIQNKQVFLKL